MSMRRLTVFLSSTGADLAPYRRAIIDHMRPLDGFLLDAMEDFGARDGGAIAVCREKVRAANVLVGLTGHYRGWEPAGDNQQRSITEMEYDWACQDRASRLMYVAPDVMSDLAPPQTDAERERQLAFRARVLAENVCDARFLKGHLRDPAEVAAAVVGALANLTFREALALMQARDARTAPPSPAPSTAVVEKRGMFDWLLGRKLQTVTPTPDAPPPVFEQAQPQPAAEPASALAAFAHDPAYAALLDPATFEMAKLEAAVVARSEARLGQANAERRAAAADYKRLAELTGYFDIEKARNYYARAVAADPTDGDALHSFCELSTNTGNTAEAEAACARFDPVVAAAADPRGAFWAQIGYGDLCAAQGNLPTAMHAYTGARDVAERLAISDPGNAGWQFDLGISNERIGDVQMAQGNLAAALKSFEAKREIISRLAKSDPGNAGWQRDVSVSYIKVGDVLVAQGQLPDALTAFRDSLSIAERLAKSDPGNAGWQRDVSVSYNKVGDVLVAQGQLPDALTAFRDSLSIRERLAKSDPGNAGWQYDLGISNERIGDVQMAQGDLAAALKSFEAKREIISRLAKSDPGNAGWQRDVSVSYDRVGDVLVAQGQLPDALKAFRDSLSIRERLAKSDPGNAGWQRDVSVSYEKVGDVLSALGQLPDALTAFRDSVSIAERLAISDPGNAGWQADLAGSHGKLGLLYVKLGDKAEALRLFKSGRAIVAPFAERSGHQLWIGYLRSFDAEIAALSK